MVKICLDRSLVVDWLLPNSAGTQHLPPGKKRYMPFISAAFWLICEDAEKISWRRRGRRAKLQAGKNINEDLGLFWLVALVLRCVYGCLTCSGFGSIGRLLCGVCVSNYCTICYKTAHPPYSGRTGLLLFNRCCLIIISHDAEVT